jgi:hypothetical protein
MGYRHDPGADVLHVVAHALRGYCGYPKTTGSYGESAERMRSIFVFDTLTGLDAIIEAENRNQPGFALLVV